MCTFRYVCAFFQVEQVHTYSTTAELRWRNALRAGKRARNRGNGVVNDLHVCLQALEYVQHHTVASAGICHDSIRGVLSAPIRVRRPQQ